MVQLCILYYQFKLFIAQSSPWLHPWMSWAKVMMIKAALHGSLSGFIALFPRSSLSTRTATYSCGGCALLNCRLLHSRFNLYEWCPLELCTELISTAIAMNLLTAAQWSWCYYSHFKNKKIGAHKNFLKSLKYKEVLQEVSGLLLTVCVFCQLPGNYPGEKQTINFKWFALLHLLFHPHTEKWKIQ